MDYLTLENRGTPEQFLDMFRMKIDKTQLLPKCYSFTDNTVAEMTYDMDTIGKLLQLVYTSGYSRGKNGKPYDLRESKNKNNTMENKVPEGAIAKYYFEKDNIYRNSISYFNPKFGSKRYNSLLSYVDKRGKFVYLYEVNKDRTRLFVEEFGEQNSIAVYFSVHDIIQNHYFWVSTDCVELL